MLQSTNRMRCSMLGMRFPSTPLNPWLPIPGSSPAWDKTKGSRDNVWGSYPTWVDSKVEKGRR